jgi:hypothetical protein
MKNRILILFLSFLTLGLVSCNDYLELTPTDKITDKSVWENQAATDLYVNNFYEYIHVYSQFGEGQFSGNLTEGLTETFKYGSPIVGNRAGDCNYYVFTPETLTSEGSYLDCWSGAYERIRRINEFLAAMENYSTYSAEVNTLYEAQARFFRAFLYFQLAKRYGGQAIIFKSLAETVKNTPLTSAKDTWQYIYDEFTFAANNLPTAWDSANTGRVTKGAAYAMLCRAMIYAERWSDAKAAGEEVLKLGYSLASTYEAATKGGNSESILEFNYLVTGPNHYWDRYMCMYYEYTTAGGATPTQEMVESYEDKDGNKVDWSAWHTADGTTKYPPYESLEPRFAATILYNGAIWKDVELECCVDGTYGTYVDYGVEPYPYGKTVTGYYMRKFRQETNTNLTSVASTSTWVELRLAEVLLNLAEAEYELGQYGTAMNYIAQVRSRVGLPTDLTLEGDDCFAALRHERKIELAYEGHLWWDMRRWGLAEEAYTGYRVHGLKITKEGSGFRYTYVDCDGEDREYLSRMNRLPIPDEELLNNSTIEQFPEWNF